MKLVVNRDRCEANGLCEGAAPEVFHLGDDDELRILVAEPGPELIAKVERAIALCPKRALDWSDV